jgi:hypothetical protein
MKTFFVILCSLSISSLYAQTTIFQQNFNSSNTVSDYIGSPPSTNQFDFIRTSGSGATTSISNGKLQLAKIGNNAVNFGRITDFSSIPTVFALSFKLSVSNNSAAITSAAVLYVGDGFDTDLAPDNNTSTYAKLAFNISATNGEFAVRNILTSTNSPVFSGEQHIRWVLNNSGSSINYVSPTNTIVSVGNDKADVWVGNTLVFNDVNVLTPSVNIANFKFLMNDGYSTFSFDDIVIQEGNIVLPIELSKLETKPTQNSIFVHWQTATETNNHYFDIEHSLDAKAYNTIGQIKGHGTKLTTTKYAYEHTTPSVGNNYYRLKQVDFDGTFTYSPIISVDFDGKRKGIALQSNITDALLQVDSDSDIAVAYRLVDMMGKVVKTGYIIGNSTLDISALQANFYVLKLETGYVFKVLKY